MQYKQHNSDPISQLSRQLLPDRGYLVHRNEEIYDPEGVPIAVAFPSLSFLVHHSGKLLCIPFLLPWMFEQEKFFHRL